MSGVNVENDWSQCYRQKLQTPVSDLRKQKYNLWKPKASRESKNENERKT